jgi:hypothetical protein
MVAVALPLALRSRTAVPVAGVRRRTLSTVAVALPEGEHRGGVSLGLQLAQRRGTVAHPVHLEAQLPQAVAEPVAEQGVVFSQQDAHVKAQSSSSSWSAAWPPPLPAAQPNTVVAAPSASKATMASAPAGLWPA